jgi:hypothetical protein
MSPSPGRRAICEQIPLSMILAHYTLRLGHLHQLGHRLTNLVLPVFSRRPRMCQGIFEKMS